MRALPWPAPSPVICVLLLTQLAVVVSCSQSCFPEELTGYQLLQSFLIGVKNHIFLINYCAPFISVKLVVAFSYNVWRFTLAESRLLSGQPLGKADFFSLQTIIIASLYSSIYLQIKTKYPQWNVWENNKKFHYPNTEEKFDIRSLMETEIYYPFVWLENKSLS